MTEMKKLEKEDMKSADIVKENIEQLKQLFPEVFSEDKINFEKLEEILGNYVNQDEDHYNFTWHGKKKAARLAQTPSAGTLRPAKDESVDFDNTQNLFIEGDNIEVLKLLQKSYHRKVKMIYIDPPYNTGNDFVYEDDFKDGVKNYLEMTGQIDGEGKKLGTNSSSAGRYHTNWLNMMYPRLKLARNLLRDDGVIFISIDDNEQINLKRICDDIFGEENFRNHIITRRRVKSLNMQFADDGLTSMNVGFEYILVYAKSSKFLMKALQVKKKDVPTKGTWNVFWSGADRPTMRYELLGFTPETGQWRWSKEKAEEAIKNYDEYLAKHSEKISLEDYWRSKGSNMKFIRRIPDGQGKNGGVQYWIGPSETYMRTSNWTDIEVSQIRKDFDLPFENPKNVDLIKTIAQLCQDADFTILDFFAGSATTAHAVMQLNAEDGGNRKCISVQLPELTDEKSESYKAGYKNIAEISKERIRRAAKKIKQENPDYQGDLGFKVFKLDSSNIKRWDANFDNLKQNLIDAVDYIKQDRSNDDIVYEILLKYGLDLAVPIEIREIAGAKIYIIGLGALVICLDKNITMEVVNGICTLKTELSPEIMRVVFSDNGFKDDVIKTNAIATLKRAGIEDIKSL